MTVLDRQRISELLQVAAEHLRDLANTAGSTALRQRMRAYAVTADKLRCKLEKQQVTPCDI